VNGSIPGDTATFGAIHMTLANKSNAPEEQQTYCLAQAYMLWCLGDWAALDKMSSKITAESETELILYIIAAQYQLGNFDEAKQLLHSLQLDKHNKVIAAKLLISGVFNSLAKANACTFNHNSAEQNFSLALTCALPQTISQALINARANEQLAQLGLPRLVDDIKPSSFKPDALHHFTKSSQYFSHEPSLQVALAEYHQLNEQYDRAIVHWQNVSGLLNTDTPQIFYDRLKDAYKSVKSFPQGNIEQETLRGDIDKHRLLSEIHNYLQPEFYFEIGVQTGKSLSLAKCEALGIDPMPILGFELPATAKVITSSSDSFFKKQSDLLLKKSIDLCFIDGMHLFEYALRDFINVEKYAQPHSLIVIDDISPGHPDQAKRERCTRAWTGDVWKVKTILEKYRPDLFMLAIDAYPTGLLLITALNPENTTLDDNYQSIVDEYIEIDSVPNDVLARDNSISGKSEKIKREVECLQMLRTKKAASIEIKKELTDLVQSM